MRICNVLLNFFVSVYVHAPNRHFRPRGIQEINQRVPSMVDVLYLMRKWCNNLSVDHSPQCVMVVTLSFISTTSTSNIQPLHIHVHVRYVAAIHVGFY